MEGGELPAGGWGPTGWDRGRQRRRKEEVLVLGVCQLVLAPSSSVGPSLPCCPPWSLGVCYRWRGGSPALGPSTACHAKTQDLPSDGLSQAETSLLRSLQRSIHHGRDTTIPDATRPGSGKQGTSPAAWVPQGR